MPFSGGTFSLVSSNPVTTGTTISSTWANNTLSDIATGLSTCLLKDGTQTVTANIPMSNFKFTGLAAGSSTQDSATIGGSETFTSKTLTNPANTKQSLTDAATISWDASSGSVATVTITASRTMGAPTNLKTGGRYVLLVTQDGTGGWSLTWNAVFKAQGGGTMPQPETTASVTTVFVFDSPDGTNLYLNECMTFTDTNPIVRGSSDTTKKLRVEVDGLTTATTRVWTAQDKNIVVIGQEDYATQAQMEAVTASSVFVSPQLQHFHPGMPKAWAKFDGTSTGTFAPTAGYNITSITRTGTGTYVANFAITFSAATYAFLGNCDTSGGVTLRSVMKTTGGTYTTTQFGFSVQSVSDITSAQGVDASFVSIAFFGDI